MEERREAGGGGGGGGGGWEEGGLGQQSGGGEEREIEGGGEFWGRVARGGGWENFGRGEGEIEKNKSVLRRERVIIFLIGSDFGEPMKKKVVRTHSINRTLY